MRNRNKTVKVNIDLDTQTVFDLYNRVINPTDQSIDWNGFFMWCAIKEIEDIEFIADLLLTIRSKSNELANKKSNVNNSLNNLKNNNLSNEDLLIKKFIDKNNKLISENEEVKK